MTSSGEIYRDMPKEMILDDIAIRVRGYARHLAVVPVSPVERDGVYRLPESWSSTRPYVITRLLESEFEDVTPAFALGLSSGPGLGIEDSRETVIWTGPESDGIDNFMIFTNYDMDPTTPAYMTHSLARRVLALLTDFDKMIPHLIPEPDTASMIQWLNSQHETWRI